MLTRVRLFGYRLGADHFGLLLRPISAKPLPLRAFPDPFIFPHPPLFSPFSRLLCCDRVTARANTPAESRSIGPDRGAEVTIDSARMSSQETVVQRPTENLTTSGLDPTSEAVPRMGVVRADRSGPDAVQQADCSTGEGNRRRRPVKGCPNVHRPVRDSASAYRSGARDRTRFLRCLPRSSGKGPDRCLPLDDLDFLLPRPVSSREVTARREPWDVAGPGATLAPALAHATDPAVPQRRAASVGDDPCRCASRIPARRPSGSRGRGGCAPAAVIPYEESFPCGDS